MANNVVSSWTGLPNSNIASTLWGAVPSSGYGSPVLGQIIKDINAAQSTRTETNRTETEKHTTRQQGTVTDTSRGSQTRDNFDAASRAAYNQLLKDLTTGGTADYKAQKQRELETVQNLLDARNEVAGASVEAKVSGDIAAINRNLTENILPKLLNAQEQGGASFSALSQLLAQDAAIKTSEAASRVYSDARSQALAQQMQIDQMLLGTTGKEDYIANKTMQLLDIGRQAYEKIDTFNERVQKTDMTTTTDIVRNINEIMNSSGVSSQRETSQEGRDPVLDALAREGAIQSAIRSGLGQLTPMQAAMSFGRGSEVSNQYQRENVLALINQNMNRNIY